ncbi:MAG TPA: uracil-DNA glycosylase [Bacteroidota bacterium]|nr:uracil-DNA glycosylase [Bacteroidota bacterium]
MSKELSIFLDQARAYLMQQQDLFGNTIYTEGAGKKTAGSRADTIAYPDEPWVSAASLPDLYDQIHECLKCPLGQTRTRFVFGTGNLRADVMFIGEAPGADEDAQGEPFVGKAGQLLNKIIEAIGMKREEVYICNILKCRPPNNRDPETSEMETCSPYLLKQIELIRPKFIICLGRISAQWLLQTNESLTALRSRTHTFKGSTLIVTYHPAALLRNPGWKRPAWEDMKLFMGLYEQSKQEKLT